MRVLIVEDSRVGQLLCTVLERDGHEPVLAGDGATGWREVTGADPPQMLILDRMLPDMDGADLLTRLRRDTRTAALPVLMLTAAARASRDLDDGVLTRVLGKPFDLVELRRVLSELAGN
ncbi:response regulator transcription factor [Actinomadura darangshiensis]|uniref:Response regulator transcription factor n=1 Tax=Actinomadura darangshiensis TaxID=705336 RepID=A0A4R5BG74_9ACTN|nr:response regulator [Actinomadura darangshiensis]TDD85608.1 response regulator transcription factor [Actinomadura darangshiensis]